METRNKSGKFVSGHKKLGGRKVGSISLTTKLKSMLESLPKGQRQTYADLLVNRIIKMALDGDVAMLKLVWNYIDGFPRANLNIGGSEGRPIPILSILHNVRKNGTNTAKDELD